MTATARRCRCARRWRRIAGTRPAPRATRRWIRSALALENFDAVGAWRAASESGEPIDAAGELPDGAAFSGPADLRQVLLARPGQFVETVVEKLLMYATGRGLEYYDRPAIRAIAREAAADGHRLSALVLGVARSAPFRMRRAAGQPGAAAAEARP